MADESISLELFIEADKANLSLGELEKGFEAMKEQLKTVGRGSEEFKKLSTAMAETGREVKNIELGFEALDNEQVASELGSVSSAVADVTAAFVLMGGESENMQQMAASIQTAMAVSMGFKGAIEGVSSGMKLYNNLVKTGKIQTVLYSAATKIAAVATRVFNAVLKANPIALLVTAFVAAGAALLVFAKNTAKASREQEILGEIQEDVISGMAKEEAQMQSLAAIAKDETQTRHARTKAIAELNKISPEYLGNLTLETINTKEATVAMEAYTASLESAARAKVLQAKLEEATAKLIEAESGKTEDLIGQMGIFDVVTGGLTDATGQLNETRAEGVKGAQAEVDAITNLIKAQNKEAESSSILNLVKSSNIVDVAALEKKVADAKLARAKAAEEEEKRLFEERRNRKDMELVQTIAIAEEEVVIEQEKTYTLFQLLAEQTTAKARAHQEELDRIQAEKDARLQAQTESLDGASNMVASIASVNNAALAVQLKNAAGNAAQEEKIRKAHFEREKKLNIAMALINGAQAVLKGFASGGLPVAILAGVTTAASIASIMASTYQGGGSVPAVSGGSLGAGASGASAGSGGAQINAVSNTSTILGEQTVNVVETDITNTQNNVNVIEESATF